MNYKKIIRVKGNICLLLKPNKYRDIKNLYQDEAGMDKTLNEFKNSIST